MLLHVLGIWCKKWQDFPSSLKAMLLEIVPMHLERCLAHEDEICQNQRASRRYFIMQISKTMTIL